MPATSVDGNQKNLSTFSWDVMQIDQNLDVCVLVHFKPLTSLLLESELFELDEHSKFLNSLNSRYSFKLLEVISISFVQFC